MRITTGRSASFSTARRWQGCLVICGVFLAGGGAFAQTIRYAWPQSPAPLPPFTTWDTAAHTLQEVVDAADPGDWVWAADGVYADGGRAVDGALTNRVAVDKPLTLASTNGPGTAWIQGRKNAGDASVRCVLLANGAQLIGFSLVHGGTRAAEGASDMDRSGAGVYCYSTNAVVSNCILRGGAAAYAGGAVVRGSLFNCRVLTNAAGSWGGGTFYSYLRDCDVLNNTSGYAGGGVYYANASNCQIQGNGAARDGGGAALATLINCRLASNAAAFLGGGADDSTLAGCWVAGNCAIFGAGMAGSTAYDSTFDANRALAYGGGAFLGSAYRCTFLRNYAQNGGAAHNVSVYDSLLHGNTATNAGGGVYECVVQASTIVDNHARYGGGAYTSVCYNSIVYYNQASVTGMNSLVSLLDTCCVDPATGTAPLTNAPLVACLSNPRLLGASPCRDRANPAYLPASDWDVEGEERTNGSAMDLGADEIWEAALTGKMEVAAACNWSNGVVVNTPVRFQVEHSGKPQGYRWNFADGQEQFDTFTATHAFTSGGLYQVAVCASNVTGSATGLVQVRVWDAFTSYVAPAGLHVAPFTNWTTAATTLQAAVDAVVAGGLVLVTDGVYESDGRAAPGLLTNRVAIDRPMICRSVNGPAVTFIKGRRGAGGGNNWDALRGVYITNGAQLIGFTVTGGATRVAGHEIWDCSGGGLLAEPAALVSNCIIEGNLCKESGAGAYGGRLVNCTLRGNGSFLVPRGGGAAAAELAGCLILTNSAEYGGGGYQVWATACLFSNNQAQYVGGGVFAARVEDCVLQDNVAWEYGGGAAGDIGLPCHLRRTRLHGNFASSGGAAAFTTLENCLVAGNAAYAAGGGLYRCSGVMNTIASNHAQGAGGAALCDLTNSVVYHNAAVSSVSNYSGGTFSHCCAAPPAAGAGNLSADPQFAGPAQLDFQLTYGSPLIDAGASNAAYAGADLAGVARPVDGNYDGVASYDMGCLEYAPVTADSDGDTMFDDWEHRYRLDPTNAADALMNPDGDCALNWEEHVADTVPTNADSCFEARVAEFSGTETWELPVGPITTNSRIYDAWFLADLGGPQTWLPVGLAVPGDAGGAPLPLLVTNGAPQRFYRLGVRRP